MKFITNANSRSLDQITPTLPTMEATISDWFQNLTFTVIKKETINFEVVETRTNIQFQGIVEFQSPQNLDISPTGQRKWKKMSVWATPDLTLNPDDIFIYQGIPFRVMYKNDWSAYGYNSFECVEDFRK
jgi:hypothetical protein